MEIQHESEKNSLPIRENERALRPPGSKRLFAETRSQAVLCEPGPIFTWQVEVTRPRKGLSMTGRALSVRHAPSGDTLGHARLLVAVAHRLRPVDARVGHAVIVERRAEQIEELGVRGEDDRLRAGALRAGLRRDMPQDTL